MCLLHAGNSLRQATALLEETMLTVDIYKFKLMQLQRRVQRDGHNCGVLCLKVCMHVAKSS